jgi:hypothetical protein
MSQFFLSFDTQDALAERCAAMIAQALQDAEVVVPHKSWALGSWKQYLQTVVAEAETIIVILSPGYVTSMDRFVQPQRLLVQQAASRLLVVQLGNCQPWLSEESVFSTLAPPIDFMPIIVAEEDFRQCLFDGIRHIG